MRSVPRISRSALAFFVAAFALLTANRASAQYGGAIGAGAGGVAGTSALAASDFTYYLEETSDGKTWVQMNTTDQQYFMNRARCECVGDVTKYSGSFKFVIVPAANTVQKITSLLAVAGGIGEARIYAGGTINCSDIPATGVNISYSCTNLLGPTTPLAGIEGGMAYFEGPPRYESTPIPVAWLYGSTTQPVCEVNGTPCNSTSTCSAFSGSITIYFWARTKASNSADVDTLQYTVNLVGNVPHTPTSVTAEGVNNALAVNWSWLSGDNPAADSNFKGVQIFCQRGPSDQVFDGAFGASYQTSASLCKDYAPTTASNGAFSQLDPKYLCSGLIPSNQNSYRIEGLQNGIWYSVAVAAVDKYGNIGPLSNIAYGKPIPTVDFYSEYKNAGGLAKGGFCSLGSWHSRKSATLGICLVGLALVLVLRRRKGPPGIGPFALMLASGTLFAGQARAQVVHHDDSLVEDQVSEAWGGTPREYAIEARFGLYMPNVDSEFSGSGTKPQSFIFGSKRRPMWQLEFDWEFLQEFGTLALGGVIGYYKENATACKQIELLQDPTTCVRSGDNTSLRLIPLAVLLVYRLDEAATRWKIPLVPYGKIGLNYTIWTITDGNGGVAWSGGSKGQGGTMGWQAAVGLSLQLDFLDPGAARGFDADSGVNHTYAFFELDHVDGSGLYRKDVLRVGDNTWFTGLMFEF